MVATRATEYRNADRSAATPLPRPKEMTMPIRKRQAWFSTVGERVQIRQHGLLICEGYVDHVTKDDQILWVAREGVETRKMFPRAEGFEVWFNDIGEFRI